MIRTVIYLVCAGAAQILTPIAFGWIYHSRYGSQTLSSHVEELLTIVVLATAAMAGFLLGGRAAYRLLYYAPRLIAWPVLLLVCVPLFVSASIYLYAFIIFRGWA